MCLDRWQLTDTRLNAIEVKTVPFEEPMVRQNETNVNVETRLSQFEQNLFEVSMKIYQPPRSDQFRSPFVC